MPSYVGISACTNVQSLIEITKEPRGPTNSSSEGLKGKRTKLAFKKKVLGTIRIDENCYLVTELRNKIFAKELMKICSLDSSIHLYEKNILLPRHLKISLT